MNRRIDWIVAACLTAAAVLYALWPPPARPDDLDLQVTVHELPNSTDGRQVLELVIRWDWKRPIRRPAPRNLQTSVGVALDPLRWAVEPRTGAMVQPETWRYLDRVGEPRATLHYGVDAYQPGELRLKLTPGHGYRAEAVPLRVHFAHVSWGRLSPPTHSWVKGVSETYRLK